MIDKPKTGHAIVKTKRFDEPVHEKFPQEKIVVYWTKEISLPHFNRYRLKFRKVFSGMVSDFCFKYRLSWSLEKRIDWPPKHNDKLAN